MAEHEFKYSLEDPQLFEIVVVMPDIFTSRQVEILELLIQGRSNKEIASILLIRESSVKNYLRGIPKARGEKTKMGLYGITKQVANIKEWNNDRVGMIYHLIQNGVLELQPLKKEKEC